VRDLSLSPILLRLLPALDQADTWEQVAALVGFSPRHLRRLLGRLRAALPFPPHALPPYAFAQHLLAALAETPLEVYLARQAG
jgi:hypothetical protein